MGIIRQINCHIGPSPIPFSWLDQGNIRHKDPFRTHPTRQVRMVYLTMTSAIVAALEAVDRLHLDLGDIEDLRDIENVRVSVRSLGNHAIGNPIGHEHIVAISKLLRNHNEKYSTISVPYHLDNLLRGSRIYQESPKPKAEPVSCRLERCSNTPFN